MNLVEKEKPRQRYSVETDDKESSVRARWSFSPGDLKVIEDDDFWNATVSTVPTELDDSINSEEEFAEDINEELEDIVPPPPPPESPTARDKMIQDCYKNFREMSLSPAYAGKPRVSTIGSPVTQYKSPRPSIKKQEGQRRTRSLHNRESIRQSLKGIMNAFDGED